MLIRIDAARLTDATSLHNVLNEAFGFTPGYGKNLDALVDCLTHLDDLGASMSRIQLLPGQIALLVIEHTEGMDKRSANQVKALSDAVAFVNWRRLERKQPPVVALAYENG